MSRELSKRTINILRKVQAAILEEPRRLDMANWGRLHRSDVKRVEAEDSSSVKLTVPPCRTTACIAGHVLLVTPEGRQVVKPLKVNLKRIEEDAKLDGDVETFVSFPGSTDRIAGDILGIDDHGRSSLFYIANWPDAFEYAYHNAKTPLQRAKVAAKRIDHFIAHGE